jgi:hypothetical protein
MLRISGEMKEDIGTSLLILMDIGQLISGIFIRIFLRTACIIKFVAAVNTLKISIGLI